VRKTAVSILVLTIMPFFCRADEPPPLPSKPLTKDDCDRLAQLSPEQLQQRLGCKPAHVCRQILFRHYQEQWIYEQPYQVRVEVDYPPRGQGRKPQVLTIQPLTIAGR
jgi:hypothetical protein